METAKLTIRIKREELERLRKAAEEDKRTVNGQVLYYISQALNDRKAS